jgi:Uma2 family endonuclease
VQMVMEPFTSLDEYLAWADQRPEEEHYEVVDGVPVMSPSPGGWHQFALAQLLLTLSAACPPDHVVLPAPLDWVLWQAPRLQIREPDLLVIPRPAARAPLLTHAPLIAVEILSPTSFERDVVAKRREYALAGLDHYWIVDPQTPQVAAYRRKDESYGLVAQAIGDADLVITEPFNLRLRPSELVA